MIASRSGFAPQRGREPGMSSRSNARWHTSSKSLRVRSLPPTFTFDQMDEAYDVFKNAAANEALKVIITPG
jgi:threonine dehydrogenase-like Zn-dependent dehydrogenase